MNPNGASVVLAALAISCAPRTGYGCIEVVDETVFELRQSWVAAEFNDREHCAAPPPRDGEVCRGTRHAPRPLFDFGPPPHEPTHVSAGLLTLSGLSPDDVVIERTGGVYFEELASGWPEGLLLSASTTGDWLPPLSIEAATPPMPIVSAPERLAVGEDLVLRWVVPPAGVELEIVVTDTAISLWGGSASVVCVPDASTGELTIPAATVAMLDTAGRRAPLFVDATFRNVVTRIENGVHLTFEARSRVLDWRIAR